MHAPPPILACASLPRPPRASLLPAAARLPPPPVDDALDTVLEVPIPEEMFSGGRGSRGTRFGCTDVKAWMRSHNAAAAERSGSGEPCSMSRGELQLMLGVIGAPLIPLPVSHAKQSPSSLLCKQLKGDPIEYTRSMGYDLIWFKELDGVFFVV